MIGRGHSKSSAPTGPHQCPVCESDELEETEEIGPVCAACGIVLGSSIVSAATDSAPPRSDEWIEGGEGVLSDWSAFYTVSNSTEQQFASTLELVETTAPTLHISSSEKERAAKILASAATEDSLDGKRSGELVAAAIHIASREAGHPRPQAVTADATSVDPSKVGTVVRTLGKECDTRERHCQATEYLPYLASELGCRDTTVNRAREILESAGRSNLLAGRSPLGAAGAALYLANQQGVTQKELASAAGVSTETIRVRLKEFREAEVAKL